MTYIATQLLQNLDVAILNIVILLAIRSALAESYLAKELNIKVKKDIILEVFLTLVFILTGWFVDSWMIMLLYGMSYFVYLIIKKKDITGTIQNIKSLIKA
jgi:Zn-dependent protease with chaperone function